MDAACAASAIVGLVFNCATAIKTCNELCGKYKNADNTLRSIATESTTVRSALLQLQHLMMRDPAALSSRWDFDSMLPQTFEMAIDSFQSMLLVLIKHLDEFSADKRPSSSSSGNVLGKLSRTRRIKLLWDEAAMQDILVQLRAQQQSLHFLLSIIQMGTIAEIRRGIQKNGDLLQDLAKSAHELKYDEPESAKRKRKIEAELRTSNDSDYKGRDTDTENDCREPSPKRRSLSPEEDAQPLTGRTRSGRVYQPELLKPISSIFTLPRSTRETVTNKSSSSINSKKSTSLPFIPQHEATYFLRPRPRSREATPEKFPSSPRTNLSSIQEQDGLPSYFTPPRSSKSSQSRRRESFHSHKSSFDSTTRSSRRSRERSSTPTTTTPGSLYSIPNTPISISQSSFAFSLKENKGEPLGRNDLRSENLESSKNQHRPEGELVKENTTNIKDPSPPKPATVEDYMESSDEPGSPIHAETKESSSTIGSSGQETDDVPRKAVPKSRSSTSKPIVRATEADAQRYRIPVGYSLKNWDPSEEPILLLGSVFDANSLGKWIYDWTVYHNGPSTPISDMAGEFWLLLISLAGKLKRSEEIIPRIRAASNRDMVEDFVEAGERLLARLQKLLKLCDKQLLKLRKQGGNEKERVSIGTGFVDLLFLPDQNLELTERLMTSLRLWSLRFDANCDDILRRPHREG